MSVVHTLTTLVTLLTICGSSGLELKYFSGSTIHASRLTIQHSMRKSRREGAKVVASCGRCDFSRSLFLPDSFLEILEFRWNKSLLLSVLGAATGARRLVEGSVPEKDVMSFFGSIKSLTDTFWPTFFVFYNIFTWYFSWLKVDDVFGSKYSKE